MSRVFTSTIGAVATAMLLGSIATAQAGERVPVVIQPPASIDVLVFSGSDAWTKLTTTDANGKGSFDLGKLANLPKLAPQLDVFQEKCPTYTRVLLASDRSAPESKNCKYKRIGGFWWGHDEALNVKLSNGGMTPMTRNIMIGSAVGGVLLTKVLVGGGEEPVNERVVLNDVKVERPQPPQPPVTSVTNVSNFFGTYQFTATRTVDTGCNFVPSFTGQLEFSGNTDGSRVTARLIERLVRIYQGSMKADGAFDGASNFSSGVHSYQTMLRAEAAQNRVHATETLTGETGCRVAYDINGTK